MSVRHRVRRVRPLPLFLALALLCAIVGGALGTATAPPITTPPFAPTPVVLKGAAFRAAPESAAVPIATTQTQGRAPQHPLLGGRFVVTSSLPTAIPTRLAASSPIPRPMPHAPMRGMTTAPGMTMAPTPLPHAAAVATATAITRDLEH